MRAVSEQTTSKSTMTMGRFGPARGRMGAPTEKPKNSKGALKRLAAYLSAERMRVLLLLAMILITVAAGVLAPRYQSSAIDRLVDRRFGEIPRLLGFMLICYIISGIGTFLQGYASARLSQGVIRRLRGDLFHKIIGLPIGYIDAHAHGDLMSRMTNDAENVSNVISQSLGSLFSSLLTLIGTAVMMLTYSVPLTLLTCLTVIGSVVVTNVLSRIMRRYYLKRQTLLGNLNGIVEEKITGLKTVTAYNLQDEASDEFTATSNELTRTAIKADIISSTMGPIMNMLNNMSFVIVAVFGAWFAVKGYISVGVISAFTIYSRQFSRPINEMAQLYGQIQTALAGAENIPVIEFICRIVFARLPCEHEVFVHGLYFEVLHCMEYSLGLVAELAVYRLLFIPYGSDLVFIGLVAFCAGVCVRSVFDLVDDLSVPYDLIAYGAVDRLEFQLHLALAGVDLELRLLKARHHFDLFSFIDIACQESVAGSDGIGIGIARPEVGILKRRVGGVFHVLILSAVP